MRTFQGRTARNTGTGMNLREGEREGVDGGRKEGEGENREKKSILMYI